MLNCRACLWRCIQALEPPPSTLQNFRRDAVPVLLLGRQRHSLQTDALSARDGDRWHKSTQAAALKKRERRTLKQSPSVTNQSKRELSEPRHVDTRVGRRDPSMSAQDWNNRKKELQHLTDPLELANFVKKELGKDKATEMLQLVRMASHSMQCIVSWNHVIDYYLNKGRVSQALKVYNDMKKRAQFPDSYTYTILLRGLSINAHQSGTLGKALSVYHSLSAPSSRVQPSIIHTNAVLKVCARALDMDALWGVAGKIPDNGPSSANGITYNIILNAIRQYLLVKPPVGESEDEVAARKERSILEARRMWHEIVTKWRNANLRIEEELVCTMGRLLLVGSRPRDWDDVLSLVEQTMDIPRMVPRLGTPARHEAGYPHLRAPHTPQHMRFDDDHLSPSQAPARGDEFLPIVSQNVGGAASNPLSYAKPGNNTLSLVMEACQKVVAPKAADQYWDLLTDPITYNIVPDINNLNFRLRLLRQNRASSKAVEVLRDDFIAKGLQPRPGTFRIAISTCVRDKNNHNSLKNAGQILDLMSSTLEDADPGTVARYAELAASFPLAKDSDWVDAAIRLDPVVKNIKIQLGVGAQRKGAGGVGATYLTGAKREDAILALRKVFAFYDTAIFSELLSEDQKLPLKTERSKLSAFINRVTFKDAKHAKATADRKSAENKGPDDGETVMWNPLKPGQGWRERKALPAKERKPWFIPRFEDAA